MRRLRTDPEVKKKGVIITRKWQRSNPVQASWNASRTGARVRGYDWELSRSEYDALVCDCCSYCGADPSPVNGVDRVDNDVGYILSNVVTACGDCNFAKRKMTRLTFIEWARRVVEHNGV